MPLTNAEKAVIHVAKSQLHMQDEDYRALLLRAGGVSSSTELTAAGFAAVMSEFERLGFRATRGRAQAVNRQGMATPRQIGRIRALWKAYSGNDDESRLNHWLEKHLHVSHVRFLEGYIAGKAIAILTKMKTHAEKKLKEQQEQN